MSDRSLRNELKRTSKPESTGADGECRRFAGLLANRYDIIERTVPYFAALQAEVAENLVPGMAGVGQARVLDVGIGTGATSAAVFDRFDGVEITGVDKEDDMLQICLRDIGARLPPRQLKLVRSDALAFVQRMPDSSFDAVVSGFTLHNLFADERTRLLREIHRILVPGGVFCNADKYVPDDEAEWLSAAALQISRIVRTMVDLDQPDLLPIWLGHYVQDLLPARRMSRAPALLEMGRLGFQDVRFTSVHNMEAVLRANAGA